MGLQKWHLIFLLLGFYFLGIYAQEKEVTGTIRDNANTPLIGVTVYIRGTNRGTITDENGKYRINVFSENDTLVFSSIGYLTKEVRVGNQNMIDLIMEESIENLQEVVVVGYGSQKKNDLTGSVGVIDAKDVSKMPVSNIVQAMQGKMAGIQITSNSGAPGSGIMVRVRGTGTFNNSDPLYVVDGIPVSDQTGIGFLNPEDIESISVLKDASAAAIYGSRGANGVILISTKKGSAEIQQINFSTYRGIQNLSRKIPLTEGREFANLLNKAAFYDSATSIPYPNIDTLPNTNWIEEITNKNATIQNYTLSFTGGTNKFSYLVSANYFDQEGVIKNSIFKKYVFRSNTSYQLCKWLKIGENITLQHAKSNGFNENNQYNNIFNIAYVRYPVVPVYDLSGNYSADPNTLTDNPVRIANQNKNQFETNRLLSGTYIEANIISGLKFNSNLGFDIAYDTRDVFIPSYYIDPSNNQLNEYLENEKYTKLSWSWENYFSYEKSISDRHHVNTMLGMSADYNYRFSTMLKNTTGLKYPDNPRLRNFAMVNDVLATEVTHPEAAESKMLSMFLRINYAFNNKYLITANVRRDGSSRFGPENRWGTFPALAAAWKISSENFWPFDGIKLFKLRGGWGIIGNDKITDYQYFSRIGVANPERPHFSYIFDQSSIKNIAYGQIAGAVENLAIHWEETKTTNIGVDMEVWKGKMTFTADYFVKKTTDILSELSPDLTVGTYELPVYNGPEVENRGFELSLNYRDYNGRIKYNIGGNASFIKNKVISLGKDGNPLLGLPFNELGNVNLTRTDLGHPISSFYGYVTAGVFKDQDDVKSWYVQNGARPGDMRFKDLDGNDTINEKDMTFIGSPLPNLNYGISCDISYSIFDLSIFIQGVSGNKIFNTLMLTSYRAGRGNLHKDMKDAWTPENTDSNIPRLTFNENSENYKISDFYVRDGSYVRLKNIQFGITLPSNLTNRLHVSKFRLYLSGQNIFTITKYNGLDPELSGQLNNNNKSLGIDFGAYPQSRAFLIGVDMTF